MKFTERGYLVKETGPVYQTLDMDKTVLWFEDVLGWYAHIDERDSEGKGLYGCVYDLPHEFEQTHLAPFTGIHLFSGKPTNRLVAFMRVTNIERLYAIVRKSGWQQITDVQLQPWGSKVCTITTIDGTLLRFFE